MYYLCPISATYFRIVCSSPFCFPSLLSFSLVFSSFLILLAFSNITRKRCFCSFSQWNIICHSQRILNRKSLELLRDSHSSLAWPPSLLHCVASFLELQADIRCSCMHSSSRDFAWPEASSVPILFHVPSHKSPSTPEDKGPTPKEPDLVYPAPGPCKVWNLSLTAWSFHGHSLWFKIHPRVSVIYVSIKTSTEESLEDKETDWVYCWG